MASSDSKTIANAISTDNSICEFKKSLEIVNLAVMNEIDQDTRRKNLSRVIAQHDSVAAFARAYNVDATYMRQLLSKHRPFGEKAANKLETLIGLPKGWLSVDEDEQQVLEIAGHIRKLPDDKRAQLLGFARGLLVATGQPLPVLPTRNGLISISDENEPTQNLLPEAKKAPPIAETKTRQALFDHAEEIQTDASEVIKKIRGAKGSARSPKAEDREQAKN